MVVDQANEMIASSARIISTTDSRLDEIYQDIYEIQEAISRYSEKYIKDHSISSSGNIFDDIDQFDENGEKSDMVTIKVDIFEYGGEYKLTENIKIHVNWASTKGQRSYYSKQQIDSKLKMLTTLKYPNTIAVMSLHGIVTELLSEPILYVPQN